MFPNVKIPLALPDFRSFVPLAKPSKSSTTNFNCADAVIRDIKMSKTVNFIFIF
jgi:hypothetical protein